MNRRALVVETARDTRAQAHRLRARLSPDAEEPLSQQRFSELLGVSLSSVARWESGRRPDPQLQRKLVRLEHVLAALDEFVAPEDRLTFLTEKHPLLLNMRPIDLPPSDEGEAAILSLLESAASGAFA